MCVFATSRMYKIRFTKTTFRDRVDNKIFLSLRKVITIKYLIVTLSFSKYYSKRRLLIINIYTCIALMIQENSAYMHFRHKILPTYTVWLNNALSKGIFITRDSLNTKSTLIISLRYTECPTTHNLNFNDKFHMSNLK